MLDRRTFVERLDVAGTGFTVLDRIYADGSLSDEALGGSCANVLISLAMLGHRVAPVLRLGADDAGARLVDEFEQAGALVDFISRMADLRSPILAEEIDTATAAHAFSSYCPITRIDLPRYEPIVSEDLARARSVIDGCAVFYTDRLTADILSAMTFAHRAGAQVVFEPSAIEDRTMFAEALKVVTILKSSADRLDADAEPILAHASVPVHVATYGSDGLELRNGPDRIWFPAMPAPVVRDACGSGDMVTIGLIDSLLTRPAPREAITPADLKNGVIAGQRLAAENCAYEGARGLFRRRGTARARAILDGAAHTLN